MKSKIPIFAAFCGLLLVAVLCSVIALKKRCSNTSTPVPSGRNNSGRAAGGDHWPDTETKEASSVSSSSTPSGRLAAPVSSLASVAWVRGELIDEGRIERLPKQDGDGDLQRFAVHPERVSGVTPSDGLEIGLGFDRPVGLTRLADYAPRQQNAPVAMDGIYYTVEVAGSVVFWGQTGKPENISLDEFSSSDPTPEQAHAHMIALAALAEKARTPLRIPQLSQDSIVKVWYTIYTDNPAGNLGSPAFMFSVHGKG
jgi:hypothetical protein